MRTDGAEETEAEMAATTIEMTAATTAMNDGRKKLESPNSNLLYYHVTNLGIHN